MEIIIFYIAWNGTYYFVPLIIILFKMLKCR